MREADIRPDHLIGTYLELARLDARTFFPPGERSPVPCPGCGKDRPVAVFDKDGFALARCGACASLFVTPRPSGQCFDRFYRDGASSRYWAETFFPAVAKSRREKLFAPKAARVAAMCRESGFTPSTAAEVGAGFGLFLTELGKAMPLERTIAVEPQPDMARRCREAGHTVLESFAGDVEPGGLEGGVDLVACLEVIEHVHEPLEFVRHLRDMVRPGGRVLVTGLCSDGFDLAVLGRHSRAVCPPQHINFLSVEGFRALFARAGLTILDIFTPGSLDVDIVRQAARRDPAVLEGQPFAAALLARGESAGAEFQDFLTRNSLSSHLWVWAAREDKS